MNGNNRLKNKYPQGQEKSMGSKNEKVNGVRKGERGRIVRRGAESGGGTYTQQGKSQGLSKSPERLGKSRNRQFWSQSPRQDKGQFEGGGDPSFSRGREFINKTGKEKKQKYI